MLSQKELEVSVMKLEAGSYRKL